MEVLPTQPRAPLCPFLLQAWHSDQSPATTCSLPPPWTSCPQPHRFPKLIFCPPPPPHLRKHGQTLSHPPLPPGLWPSAILLARLKEPTNQLVGKCYFSSLPAREKDQHFLQRGQGLKRKGQSCQNMEWRSIPPSPRWMKELNHGIGTHQAHK